MVDRRSKLVARWLLAGLCIVPGACGGRADRSNAAAARPHGSDPDLSWQQLARPRYAANTPTLANGPDVCFHAAAKRLGPDARASELTSFFSVGTDIDPTSTAPKGQITECVFQYQDPADPRKLLELSMNMATGHWDAPRPVEIKVVAGDEASFRLADYVIPLSQVNAAGLKAIMDREMPGLNKAYSHWAWSGVSLSPPDGFNSKHTLLLYVTGRLRTNDIKKDGHATVTTDARTVTEDALTS